MLQKLDEANFPTTRYQRRTTTWFTYPTTYVNLSLYDDVSDDYECLIYGIERHKACAMVYEVAGTGEFILRIQVGERWLRERRWCYLGKDRQGYFDKVRGLALMTIHRVRGRPR